MHTPEEEPTKKQDNKPTTKHTTNIKWWIVTTQNKTLSETEKKTQKKVQQLIRWVERLQLSVVVNEFFNSIIAQAEDERTELAKDTEHNMWRKMASNQVSTTNGTSRFLSTDYKVS